ncbi:hypothetical protein EDEG_01122 [Edhazardia aedis USNM 41457]|uniref:Uncharacterized protein n=1 Tax=Edhazardia aedis (strain USNM 41457) TaxID=1003232 RepID=J9DB03_EDHAE|nr:hypothetical protein EDEG_01122 [Edhazardia aedis USNM 41457]|eukprot:EJW04674.1 hypothetical protein EDEG_01122 [Edhazardia aedis USNM 41457]
MKLVNKSINTPFFAKKVGFDDLFIFFYCIHKRHTIINSNIFIEIKIYLTNKNIKILTNRFLLIYYHCHLLKLSDFFNTHLKKFEIFLPTKFFKYFIKYVYHFLN